MIPELMEVYEVGEVQLRVYHLNDPLRISYWLQAGSVGMEFHEETFEQLRDLIHGYELEAGFLPLKQGSWWRRLWRSD